MEGRDDLLAIGPTGDQQVQQHPGLERAKEPGVDQSSILEITLGAGETIGTASTGPFPWLLDQVFESGSGPTRRRIRRSAPRGGRASRDSAPNGAPQGIPNCHSAPNGCPVSPPDCDSAPVGESLS
jgi:hypothetical protein